MAPSKITRYTPTLRSSSIPLSTGPRPDSGIGMHNQTSSKDIVPASNELSTSAVSNVNEGATADRTMKDLPSLPHALSITSLTPSLYVDPSGIHEGSVKSLATGQSRDPSKQGPTSILAIKEMGDLPPVPPLKFKLKGMKNRNSTSSLVNGRPWNQDENYSWINEHQKLQITMPCQVQEELQDVKRLSKFKLRGSRASVTNTTP